MDTASIMLKPVFRVFVLATLMLAESMRRLPLYPYTKLLSVAAAMCPPLANDCDARNYAC
jgi:hypothetical protein